MKTTANMMNTVRRVGGFAAKGALATALLVTPASVAAQPRGGGMGGGGLVVVGTTLDKVPVGTWAEYTTKAGDRPARKSRQALVGKEGAAFVLETASESGEGERIVTRAVLDADPSKEGGMKKYAIQRGANDPMEVPVAGGGGPGGGGGDIQRRGFGRRFIKPDATKLVGKEPLKVAAGDFQTEHYRQEGPRGGSVDFWIAKGAGPFGLVKLEMDRPGGPDGNGGGKMTTELSARGTGAKAEVTKAAKPFDPSAMPRFGGGGGRGPQETPPAAATKPAAAPATPAQAAAAKPAAPPSPAAKPATLPAKDK